MRKFLNSNSDAELNPTEAAPISNLRQRARQRGNIWLSGDEIQTIGEGRLPVKVVAFVNYIRWKIREFRHDVVWLTPDNVASIEGIKLHFRQRGAWHLPLDSDGVEENDDPDGYPGTCQRL